MLDTQAQGSYCEGMNKLSKEAKEIYTEYYKILELGKQGEKLKENLPINPRRIALMVLQNLKTISR